MDAHIFIKYQFFLQDLFVAFSLLNQLNHLKFSAKANLIIVYIHF